MVNYFPMLCVLLLCISVTIIHGQRIVFGSDRSNNPSECTTRDGGRGACGLESECVNKGHNPKVCGYRNTLKVICCPNFDPSVRIGGTSKPITSFECGIGGGTVPTSEDLFLSRKKRQSSNTDFALPPSFDTYDLLDNDYEFQVVGGDESEPNSWPWMTLLGTKTRTGMNWFCDGSLINEMWILTAAHCLTNSFKITARLGEHDQAESFNINRKDYNVVGKVVSPLYTPDGGYHDVGLLKLGTKAQFGPKVGPVCLPWGDEAKRDIINQKVILTGWGTEEFGGSSSKVLREATVTIFDPKICERSYSTLLSFSRQFPEGMTTENTICAGHPEGGVDACQGDSGGPIVLEKPSIVFGKPSTYTVVGIVSKGHGCGLDEFPGLYAPVVSYLSWIKEVAFAA